SLGALLDIEPCHQFRILSCDTDWTTPGVAMMAIARLCAQLVVILDIERSVAVECYERGRSDVQGVSAEGHRLGGIHSITDAAGDNELHLAVEPAVLECCPRFADRSERRNAGVFLQDG